MIHLSAHRFKKSEKRPRECKVCGRQKSVHVKAKKKVDA